MPFRFIEPTFYAGLLDDPVLYLKIRPLGRGILVDCGQIHHLAKRVLRSLDAVFISHAHMDHFMGLDTLTRNVHVAPRTIELFGPPGLARRAASKLAGYDWNLTEAYWCSYRVHEIHADRIISFLLPGAEGFPLYSEGERKRGNALIYRNAFIRVEAALCDHKIPTLAFRITERERFAVDDERIQAAALVRGPWLRRLKELFFTARLPGTPIKVPRNPGEGKGPREVTFDAAALYERIRLPQQPPSIGYVTDVGFTRENRHTLSRFLQGVTWLACECTFLAADREKARASYHLCTRDLNALLAEVRPRFILPMHLSKSYLGETGRLYEELTPAQGTTMLRLPDHVAPAPLLAEEVPAPLPDS